MTDSPFRIGFTVQGGGEMKKQLGAWIVLGALLLGGCAAKQIDTGDLQRRYAAMDGYVATVKLTAASRNESVTYVLDVERNGDETRVTVQEPEAIAGVSAVLSGDALSLTYDGMALSAGGAPTELNAVNAADVVVRALADGFLTEQNQESFEGKDALRLCLETELNGETLHVTVFLDEADAPLYAEIERGGEIVQYLEFTDFVFGAIVEPE